MAELNEKILTVKDHADVALYGILGLIWLKEDKELTLELPTEFEGIVQLESKDECIRVLGVQVPVQYRRKLLLLPLMYQQQVFRSTILFCLVLFFTNIRKINRCIFVIHLCINNKGGYE